MKTTTLLLAAFLLCNSAYAQDGDPVLLFESEAGLRLALGDNPNLFRQNDRRDADGDGLAELPLIIEDETGDPYAFLVLTRTHLNASAPKETLNHYWDDSLFFAMWDDLVDLLGGREPTRFLGFYSFFDGSDVGLDGLKDLVFRTEDGVAIINLSEGGQKQAEASMRSFRVPAEQSFITDLDEDGVPELIVRNPETNTVQVWGQSATGTATEGEIEAALFRLFQNYPNPFRERTTITYEVERPGPVTIAIYDLLGRHVRTLVEAEQPVGTYRVHWDGHNAGGQPVASGSYFYRLRVGNTVSSKQAIRLR